MPKYDENYLKKGGQREVKDIFSYCKGLTSTYRGYKKGFTHDKSMRHVTSIPLWVLFDPEHKRYFDPKQDPHEFNKNIDRWISKNDWFDFRRHT